MTLRVAVVTASMSRLAGGLFNSVRHLGQAVRAQGHEVRVHAGRDPFSEADLPAWGDLPVLVGPVAGPRALGWQPGLVRGLRADAPDIVHQHGLWMYPSQAVLRWSRQAGRPRIISPRGMLDPWALRHSAWKKRLAAALYEDRNLHGAACLHALNLVELQGFRAAGLSNPVAVIPNGVDPAPADQPHPPPAWAGRLPEGTRVLLFLGRLHPKKGLGALIAGLEALGGGRMAPWHLVIAGWDQGGHQAQLAAQAERAGLSGRVHFVGPQYGADKSATLARADAFILPSYSEGLPMAVLEAWAFRLPVLMTDACNLPEGFAAGAAARLGPEPQAMADELGAFFAQPPAEHRRMGAAGRRLVEHRFGWAAIARDMSAVYAWCCGRGPKPACVHELSATSPR